jgi:3-oxoacyl-[acyl-carrier-protein] synthase-1
MSAMPLAVIATGMVSCAGMDRVSSCAAIRAGIANFSESACFDRGGQAICGGQISLNEALHSRARLVRFLTPAIEECLQDVERAQWPHIPLLLCVAEKHRPGRLAELDSALLRELQAEFGTAFHTDSAVVAHGHVAAAVAMLRARQWIQNGTHAQTLVAGADSYFDIVTMRALEQADRLLTSVNSNGFIAGEGAAAVLLRRASDSVTPQLLIRGLGFGLEEATIISDAPLRADGLTLAVKAALADADMELSSLAYRITDIAGEQYYFKEAALTVSRLLHEASGELTLWHPADCLGDTGAAAGLMCLNVAWTASHKRYAPGPGALLHFASDDGARAAAVVVYG